LSASTSIERIDAKLSKESQRKKVEQIESLTVNKVQIHSKMAQAKLNQVRIKRILLGAKLSQIYLMIKIWQELARSGNNP